MTLASTLSSLREESGRFSTQMARGRNITEYHFENDIPPFVGAELERLYGSIYSSLPHLASEGKLADASTYLALKDGELETIFLYRRRGSRIEVLNEVLRLEEEEINLFATYMFTIYKSMHVISFRSVESNFKKSEYQFQRFNCLEDMVVELPGDNTAYMNKLSAKTRGVLRRKLKVIARDHPSFQFEVFERNDIKTEQILEIIQFNHQRMAAGNKKSLVNDAATMRLVTLAKECGLLIVASIEGRICGGVINCKAGDNYFGLMVSHDPTYNAHSLGLLCNYRALCESMERGAKEFHFLWGRYPYKFALAAVPRELDFISLYRSKIQFFLNSGYALSVWIRWIERRYALWKYEVKKKQGFLFKLRKNVLTALKGATLDASTSVSE
jgi:hypothetical protein